MKTSNKYLKVILATTALVMIFTSCQKDKETENAASKHIKLDAGMATFTRATETEFNDGDKISVYAWAGADIAAALLAPLVVGNSINTLNGTTWSAEPVMVWKDILTPHYFVAIYPAREDGSITNFETYEFTLTGNKKHDDLLFANNKTGVKERDNKPVSLVFDHSQSKLVVNLTLRNQFGDNPMVNKVTVLAKNIAIIDFIADTTVEKSDAPPLEIKIEEVTPNTKYELVVVPQMVKKITITINGKDYTYNHPTDLALVQGKSNTINLFVGRDSIKLASSITINPWGDGGEDINGETE